MVFYQVVFFFRKLSSHGKCANMNTQKLKAIDLSAIDTHAMNLSLFFRQSRSLLRLASSLVAARTDSSDMAFGNDSSNNLFT